MATKKPPEVKPVELRIITSEELDAVLDRDSLGTKLVPVPEWIPGGAFQIRGLSMDDIYATREATSDIPAGSERQAAVDLEFIRIGVTSPVLTRPQIEKFRKTSADPVLRLIREISSLNAGNAEAGDKLAGEFPAERGA